MVTKEVMKAFLSIMVVIFFSSCGTEKHYYKKSLSNADKIYLNDHDTLTKRFSGKANWYKQYWKGNLLVSKNKAGFDFKQIGEWHQISKDATELYTITNFDEYGYFIDQRILGYEGRPPTHETYCKKDTVKGQVRLVCENTNRYHSGQIKEKGKRIIINERSSKEGKWEYYSETGTLEKVIEYKNDKAIQ
jgi:hypothetical protein